MHAADRAAAQQLGARSSAGGARPTPAHSALRLQRAAGNAAVSGLLAQRAAVLTVQRDPAKTPDELDADYRTATTGTPPDWAEATRVLNGFSDADIARRVAPMSAEECGHLLGAVQDWNHRVRAALLDNRYTAAKGAGQWGQAAVHLNGFDNPGIDERVGALGGADVWNVYQGALDAMSGVSQQRIVDAVARLHQGTVSATPGTDALRLLATMEAKGVDPAVGAPVALAPLGLTGRAPDPAPPPVDRDRLIKLVGGAMAGAVAMAVEPLMLADGKLAHTLISARYANANGRTLIDPSIIRLVRFAASVMPKLTTGALNDLYRRLPEEVLEQLKTRPDIVDFGKLQIYEIKSKESAPRAVPEMENYIELLASFKIPGFGDFTPGSPANPETEGAMTYPPGGRLVWCCPWPGAIVYHVADQTERRLSPERLRSMVRGGVGDVGVESMTALGMVGVALLAMLPEAGAATVGGAAVALRQAAVSYATLVPILVEAARQVGQQVPALRLP
ncbi:hypothetical protein R8Z50_18550 [Longispora sp. K20-0274]|uniref:hypothetical protein n=1 Tax=Longispora sp. K20-0274 TaxID=3088255 RepID=UPI00399B28C8